MRQKVIQTIEKHDLFKSGQTVLVAFSGGPDSLCLLHVLHSLAKRLGIHLHAVHINHGLRPEAAAEALWAKKQAIRLGLPLSVCRVDVKGRQADLGLSLQDAARQVRYGALLHIASRIGAKLIATGHHRDDRVETLLMRLLSGSGLEGLKGIPIRRRMRGGTEVVRPLYDVSRDEIEEYCRKHQLVPLRDPTNRCTSYLRNRVRLRLVPFLEQEFGPHIRSSLSKTADILAQDASFLAGLGSEAFERVARCLAVKEVVLDIGKLRNLPPALQTRVILRVFWHVGVKRPARLHVEQVLALARHPSPSACTTLPDHVLACREYNKLRFGSSAKQDSKTEAAVEIQIPGQTYLACGGLWLEADFVDAGDVNPAAIGRNEACLDAEKLSWPLWARTRRAGDRMQPLGASGRRKVKKILADRKIPLKKRDSIPLILSAEEIVWLGGVEVAENCKVTPQTKKILYLKLMPDKKDGAIID
ncbi:MAG: tRNA lysidine(34) synthetase TilS [Bacillota bacterium]|nr:tRNA lysidine(34) synthetase TilS [Bacillota bacterium]MDW7683070.1 tRNA lysidine(34) synthetase TilS [Bacillota bacterium]